MSMGDLMELLSVLAAIPLATGLCFFWIVTAGYVYFDAEHRARRSLFAAALALAVSFFYWPISFLAYLACTAIIDRRPAAKCPVAGEVVEAPRAPS
jgi:hypothetical protein